MKFGTGGIPTISMSISESCENLRRGNHTSRSGANKILLWNFQKKFIRFVKKNPVQEMFKKNF
jgi:hypothetical protein